MIWSNGSLDPSYTENFETMNPLGGSELMMSGVKGVDSMSSNHLLTELGGPLFVRPPMGCCAGRWGSWSVMIGAT